MFKEKIIKYLKEKRNMSEEKQKKEVGEVVSTDLLVEEKKETKEKKMNIKGVVIGIIIGLVVILVGVGIYFGRSLLVAATVNGESISRLDVIKRLEKVSGKGLLDSLIDEKLITQKAEQSGINITDEDVNSRISEIEKSVTSQGSNLDEALSSQGMSREDLFHQIRIEKMIEVLIADNVGVDDSEIDDFIATNKVEIPEGQEETYRNQIKTVIEQQKTSTEASKYVESLRKDAEIKYIVSYE